MDMINKAFGDVLPGEVFTWGSRDYFFTRLPNTEGDVPSYLSHATRAIGPWGQHMSYCPDGVEIVPALSALVQAADTTESVRASLNGEVERLRAINTRQSEQFDAWKARATTTAHQYADNNSLCSEFDRCMVAIGLEPRESYQREGFVEIRIPVNYRPDNIERSAILSDIFDRVGTEFETVWNHAYSAGRITVIDDEGDEVAQW